jgi:hypothetical protein
MHVTTMKTIIILVAVLNCTGVTLFYFSHFCVDVPPSLFFTKYSQ